MGDRVIWESVTAGALNGPNKKVRLVMSEQRLDEYDWTGPLDSVDPVGTTVTVVTGSKQPHGLLNPKARRDLTTIMALYLSKYPDAAVSYDNSPLSIAELISDQIDIDVPFENEYGPVTLTVIEWGTNMERALYLCDESGATLHEASAGIHAPGFIFTAYVRWAGFRAYESLLPLADMDNDEVGPVVNAAREVLRTYFRSKRIDDMQEVLKLPETKIEEFRNLLEQTSLTALVDAMRLVTGRLQFIAGLELLLFDPVHAPKVLERAHLHKMIESEPWLFGEEFATHVSDRSLTALLEAHLSQLGRDAFISEAVTDEDGKPRRIDFLFGRALELNRARREHLVVEIKRPTITVDRKKWIKSKTMHERLLTTHALTSTASNGTSCSLPPTFPT